MSLQVLGEHCICNKQSSLHPNNLRDASVLKSIKKLFPQIFHMASLSLIELQLAHQLVATLGKRPNAHHNGNLHITGTEERVMLLEAFDSEDEGLEDYVASAVVQREEMRKLLQAQISPLEDQFL